MRIKKYAAIFFCGLFLFLTACGGAETVSLETFSSESTAESTEESETTEETEKETEKESEKETMPSESEEETTPVTATPENTGRGLRVCIDAGHQQHGMPEMEPNGPGSTVMKAKLTTGTAGCATGRAEYQVNLEVSLKLQAELQARGYEVVMIRTTNDCPKSNAERAQIANQSGAQAFIRVHCNSVTNSAVTGTITYAPSPANPYMNGGVVQNSIRLAALMAEKMCAVTGAQNRGVLQDDTMTGINWCQIPVTIVEMGFMSNPTEDQMLSDPAYQQKLAIGMANGLDAYFGR